MGPEPFNLAVPNESTYRVDSDQIGSDPMLTGRRDERDKIKMPVIENTLESCQQLF